MVREERRYDETREALERDSCRFRARELRARGHADRTVESDVVIGTWRGTVTIQINPGDPNPPPPTSGEMTSTFEVVPQTNMQSLRARIRSTHPWLTMEIKIDESGPGRSRQADRGRSGSDSRDAET